MPSIDYINLDFLQNVMPIDDEYKTLFEKSRDLG